MFSKKKSTNRKKKKNNNNNNNNAQQGGSVELHVKLRTSDFEAFNQNAWL